MSQVFRTALTSMSVLPSFSDMPHPPCLSPGLLVLLGYMLSVTTSPLPGSHQVQAYFHTCEYSRSPRAERHADVCLGTAGCPHQERLSQVGRAAPGQLQHSSPFLERKVSRVLRLSGVFHPYRCPFEIHVRGKMYSRRTRCTLLDMFKGWHFYRRCLKLLSCFVLFCCIWRQFLNIFSN